MTQVTNTFEGGSDGTAITTGNTGGSSGTAVDSVTGSGIKEFDNAQAAHGTYSLRLNANSNPTTYFTWQAALGTVTDHYGRLYIRKVANPSSSTRIVEFRNASAGQFYIFITSTGAVAIGVSSATVTSTATLSNNTWYRLEWHTVHGAGSGTGELKIFTGDSTTATETINFSSATSSNADRVRIGMPASATNFGANDVWLDDIVAGATSYPGPPASSYALGATGLAVPVTFGSPVVEWHPKTDTLTDDFQDGTLSANYSGLATESGGTLNLALDGVNGTYAYAGWNSPNTYDLRDSSIYVKVDSFGPVSGSTSTEAYFALSVDANNGIYLSYYNGTLRAVRKNSGTPTTISSAALAVAACPWWKISESGGTITFAYGADGSSWTTLTTVSTSLTSAINSLGLELGAGHFSTGQTAGTVKFDWLNTPPINAISTTGLAVPVTFGSPVVKELISGTGLSVPVTFGSPALKDYISGTGLAVPVTFGSATVALTGVTVSATGLAVPVTLGLAALGTRGEATAIGLAIPVTFGSPTLQSYGIEATGLAIPVTFGDASIISEISTTGLAVPVVFGSPDLEVIFQINTTGLLVRVILGSPALTTYAHSLTESYTIEFGSGVHVIELASGEGIPGILGAGKITLESQ